MDMNSWSRERYLEYLEDIKIANTTLSDLKINVSEHNVLCDLYAIPSGNHQAFYAKIFVEKDHYNLLYAKPILDNLSGDTAIYMYPFRYAKKLDNIRGYIVCGIKTLDEAFVQQLLSVLKALPCKYVFGSDEVMIDGVIQAIRFFDGDCLKKEVVYGRVCKIPLSNNESTQEIKRFLENLYIVIEQIIGYEYKNHLE